MGNVLFGILLFGIVLWSKLGLMSIWIQLGFDKFIFSHIMSLRIIFLDYVANFFYYYLMMQGFKLLKQKIEKFNSIIFLFLRIPQLV